MATQQRTPDEYKKAYEHWKSKGDYTKANKVADLYRATMPTNTNYQALQSAAPVTAPVPAPVTAPVTNSVAPQDRDNAFEYSFDNAQEMGGALLETAGRATGYKPLETYGQQVQQQQQKDIAAGGYESDYKEDFIDIYKNKGYMGVLEALPTKMAESSVSSGVALGGAAITAAAMGVGAPAWMVAALGAATTTASVGMGVGESTLEQKEKLGDYNSAVSFGTGAIMGLLDKFGAGKVIPESAIKNLSVKEIGKRLRDAGFAEAANKFVKSFLSEGVTETAQEAALIGTTAAMGGEYTPREIAGRLVDAPVVGGAMGGATSAVSSSVQAANRQLTKDPETGAAREPFAAQDFAPAAPEVANVINPARNKKATAKGADADFARRLMQKAAFDEYDLNNVDVGDPRGARAAVDSLHVELMSELSGAGEVDPDGNVTVGEGGLFAQIKEAYDLSANQERLLKLALKKAGNKVKNSVDKSDIKNVQAILGDSPEGRHFVNLLQQTNALTRLHSNGYKGGVSRVTDIANPFDNSRGNYNPVGIPLNAVNLGAAAGAVASGGASLGVAAAGRAIDGITGRRSPVARFVKNNADGKGLPLTGAGGRVAAAEKAQRQERQEIENIQQAQQVLSQRQLQEGGSPNLGSPRDIFEQGTGLRTQDAISVLTQMADAETDPNVKTVLEANIRSLSTGSDYAPELSFVIQEVNRLVDADTSLAQLRSAAPQGTGVNTPQQPQQGPGQASQARLSQQQINYERGVQANQSRAAALQEDLKNDSSVSPKDKAIIATMLDKLQYGNLGSEPQSALNAMVNDLRYSENAVSPEAVEKYFMPAAQAIAQQQAAKPKDGDVEADYARVIPVPRGKPSMQARFGVDPNNIGDGGNYIDLDTQEDLTGNTYDGGVISVANGGQSLETSDGFTAPASKETGNIVRTNLFKQKAGWSWVDYDGPNTIVSTKSGKDHVYSLETDFQTPVTLETYPKENSEPRLKPTSRGKLVLGDKVGSISVRGKIHPVYEKITVVDKNADPQIDFARNPDLPARKKVHGVYTEYTVQSEGEVRGKSAIVKTINSGNAEATMAGLDGLIERNPDPLQSEDAWLAFERDLLGDNTTIAPPFGMLKLTGDMDVWSAKHQELSDEQIAAAGRGLDTVKDMDALYQSGIASEMTTAKLLLWSFLSRMQSANPQESAYLDVINDPKIEKYIQRAFDGEWTPADIADYISWSQVRGEEKGGDGTRNMGGGEYFMPVGSAGRSAVSNMNAFGKNFLKVASRRMPDGRPVLSHLHDLISDRSISSAEVRRQFHALAPNSGMQNKVLSFALLMSGREDVVVLDRIQINNGWDSARYGTNIYSDGMNDPRDGAHGLARYEAIERSFTLRMNELYARVGRPESASLGRYHWESWVRDSGQVVAHPTMKGILREAMSGDMKKAYTNIMAAEGRYHSRAFGTFYGRAANGKPFFLYSTRDGTPYYFDNVQFPKFLDYISNKKNGIMPKSMKISKVTGSPWFEKEGVNRAKLDEAIIQFSKREASVNERFAEDVQRDFSDVEGGRTAVRGRVIQNIRAYEPDGSGSNRGDAGRIPTAFNGDAARDGTRSTPLGDVQAKERTLPDPLVRQMDMAQAYSGSMLELAPGSASAEIFRSAISNIKSSNPYSAAVHVYDADQYANWRLFMTPDGDAGVAVTESGDMVSGFSGGANPFVNPHLINLAAQSGGRKSDAFDTVLPYLYSPLGLKVVARLAWDDTQSPPGWSKDTFKRYNNGEPDVVFMVYDPDHSADYTGKEGVRVTEWADGEKIQDEELARLKSKFAPDYSVQGGAPALAPYTPQAARPIPKPSPRVVNTSMPDAAAVFDIGKKGSKYENGIGDWNQARQMMEALGITYSMAENVEAFNKALGVDPTMSGVAAAFFPDAEDPYRTGGNIVTYDSKGHAEKFDTSHFLTLLHEIGHGLESRQLLNDQFYFKSFRETLAQKYKSNSTIRAEIDNLQQKVRVPVNGGMEQVRPNLTAWMTFLNDPIYGDQAKDFVKYTQNDGERATDPVWVYLYNPRLLKQVAPKTAKLIQDHFNNTQGASKKSMPVSFHANPLTVILAFVMAAMAQMAAEEEEEQQKPPPGALTPTGGVLAA